MSRAEKWLGAKGIPNIKWSKPIDFQDEVKENMDFPNSFAEIMESFLNDEVNATSDKDLELLFCKEKLGVPFCLTIYNHQTFLGFIKWFKNKLLNK